MKEVRKVSLPGMTMVVGPTLLLGAIEHLDGPKTTAEAVAENPGVFAMIDGSMFEYGPGEPHDYARYRAGVNRFALYFPKRGINIPGKSPTSGVTLGVRADGSIYANTGARVEPGSVWAAQTYPTLVYAGTTQSTSDVDNNKRVAVGFMRNGEAFLAVAPSMSMPQFARALRDAGAFHAGYTDGGGSAALWIDEEGDGIAESAYNLRGRRVVTWLTFQRTGVLETAVAAAKRLDKRAVVTVAVVTLAVAAAVVVKR